MAGDWIKVRCDLPDDPAVIAIAAATGLDEDTVVGKLVRIWIWANRHLRDGNASVTLMYLDRYAAVTGFAQAMVSAGWLEATSDGCFRIPKWDRHNSKSAKRRALTAVRVSTHRSVTGALPEKRREEKSNKNPPNPPRGECEGTSNNDINPPRPPACVLAVPLPDALSVPTFREHWLEYLQHRLDSNRPLTPTAAKRQLARLASWGADRAIRAILFTVAQGYVGLVEENGQRRNGKHDPPPESAEARAARLAEQKRKMDEAARNAAPASEWQRLRQAAREQGL